MAVQLIQLMDKKLLQLDNCFNKLLKGSTSDNLNYKLRNYCWPSKTDFVFK